MVLAIFRSRLRSEFEEEYRALAPRMLELAQAAPGFVSFKSFAAANRERVSIIEFASHEHLPAWRNHPDHSQAQLLGRKRFYSEYHLQICDPVRSYSLADGPRTTD